MYKWDVEESGATVMQMVTGTILIVGVVVRPSDRLVDLGETRRLSPCCRKCKVPSCLRGISCQGVELWRPLRARRRRWKPENLAAGSDRVFPRAQAKLVRAQVTSSGAPEFKIRARIFPNFCAGHEANLSGPVVWPR